MRSTDAQVHRLRQERARGRGIGQAAMKAGMHRNTATKYLQSGALPSEAPPGRAWRTREDAFEADRPWVERRGSGALPAAEKRDSGRDFGARA